MQKLQEQIPVKTKSCAIIAVIHELSGLRLVALQQPLNITFMAPDQDY